MSESKLPTLGHSEPAILATDSAEEVTAKIHRHLEQTKIGFDIARREAEEAGENIESPGASINLNVAYVDDESAGNILPNLQLALTTFINALPEYGFHLVDVDEWGLTRYDGEGPNEFGHTIGARYIVRIGPVDARDVYDRNNAEHFVNAKRRHDEGELDEDPGRGELEEFLRAFGAR